MSSPIEKDGPGRPSEPNSSLYPTKRVMCEKRSGRVITYLFVGQYMFRCNDEGRPERYMRRNIPHEVLIYPPASCGE